MLMPSARMAATSWSYWLQSKLVGPPYCTYSQLASILTVVTCKLFLMSASWLCCRASDSPRRSGSLIPTSCPELNDGVAAATAGRTAIVLDVVGSEVLSDTVSGESVCRLCAQLGMKFGGEL